MRVHLYTCASVRHVLPQNRVDWGPKHPYLVDVFLGHVLQVGPLRRGYEVHYVQDVSIATQEVKR